MLFYKIFSPLLFEDSGENCCVILLFDKYYFFAVLPLVLLLTGLRRSKIRLAFASVGSNSKIFFVYGYGICQIALVYIIGT